MARDNQIIYNNQRRINSQSTNKKDKPIANRNNDRTRDRDDNIIIVSEYDPVIFFVVVILVLFGLVMIFSSSYYVASTNKAYQYDTFKFVKQQGFSVFLGFGVMIIAAVVSYSKWFKGIIPLLVYIAANLMLIYVKFFGTEMNGAKRWIDVFGIISIQPSEIAKASVILLLALFISNDITRVKRLSGLAQCLVIIGIPVFLVFWGKNMSTALIILAIGGGLIFITSPYTKIFIGMAGGFIALVATYLTIAEDFRAARFAVWGNPFSDPLGKGYQTIQSLYAVASGGLFGLGLGQSRQKLSYIPEPQNDFIFAIICEELGFFGGAFVILLFMILIWRGMKVALNAPDLHGMLIAMGIVILISVHVIINIGVVTNALPNTGIPLPFISYGGTSVIIIMGLMGILLNISRYSKSK